MNPELRVARTEDLSGETLDAVRGLMEDAFESEFTDDDWDHTTGGVHIMVFDDGDLVSHAAVVERILTIGNVSWRVGYMEGVATATAMQGHGHGSLAMARAAELIESSFELGAMATSAHHFYERLGWERWQGPTFVRYPDGLVRTEDEDDGIMVLRFGPSATLDRSLSITCDARPGDDW